MDLPHFGEAQARELLSQIQAPKTTQLGLDTKTSWLGLATKKSLLGLGTETTLLGSGKNCGLGCFCKYSYKLTYITYITYITYAI